MTLNEYLHINIHPIFRSDRNEQTCCFKFETSPLSRCLFL